MGAAISLMAMGLSVEFTAHFAAAFSLGQGTAVERLGAAMAHTFPALMEGSVSTFCTILPLAFAEQLFLVKYLFGIITMVVVVGFINGVVVMPAMLALLHNLSAALCGQAKKPEAADELPTILGANAQG